MAVHSNGNGSGWLEDLDADQPHGLDWREFNDFRIGIRFRLRKEHVEIAAGTVGGEHRPGGCAVAEFIESTSDMTNYYDDGSYVGGGLIWCYSSGRKFSTLFCTTGDGTYGTAGQGDLTVLKLNPANIWDASIVWPDQPQQFDGSVDMTATCVQGSFCLAGHMICTSAVEVSQALYCNSGAEISAMLKCYSSAYFTDDVSCKADLVVDGTALFTTNVDISGNADISGILSVSGDISNGTKQVSTAWAFFGGEAGGTILGSYNIASLQRFAEGDYSLTFTTALPSANYAVFVTAKDPSVNITNTTFAGHCYSQKTTGVRVIINGYNTNGPADVSRVSVMVFGG